MVNTTGAVFDLFGVKQYRITKERVYGLLDPELRAELIAEPNVKLPMNLMIQGLQDDHQLPLARSVTGRIQLGVLTSEVLTPVLTH